MRAVCRFPVLPALLCLTAALATACVSRSGQRSMAPVDMTARGATALDSISDEVAIYSLVLEHALARYPARRNMPVVLDARTSNAGCAPHCVDSTRIEWMHPAHVVEHLRARGLIQATCVPPPGAGLGCPAYRRYDHVWIGIPFRLNEKFRIAATEGVELVTAIPSGTQLHAETALDVVVNGRCGKSAACRSPNLVRFRYFLARGESGAYRIIARMVTGSV